MSERIPKGQRYLVRTQLRLEFCSHGFWCCFASSLFSATRRHHLVGRVIEYTGHRRPGLGWAARVARARRHRALTLTPDGARSPLSSDPVAAAPAPGLGWAAGWRALAVIEHPRRRRPGLSLRPWSRCLPWPLPWLWDWSVARHSLGRPHFGEPGRSRRKGRM